MAHLMKSSPRVVGLPLMWNVDAAVGSGGANMLEDVYLVQYMMKMIGTSPKPMQKLTPAQKAQLAALMVSGKCDPYTIECIKAVQTAIKAAKPTTVVDGRVSRSDPTLKYGANWFMIANFNFTYRDCYWNNWPVICLDGEDSTITDLVYREMYGTPAP